MTYAIEYFAGQLPEEVHPNDVVWQRLADVVGVDYESIIDVMSLVADLEFCEENRGKYRVIEFCKNGRDVMCCSCGDVACQVPQDMPATRAEILPRRTCRACGLTGKIEISEDGEAADFVFATDEADGEQRRAEGERQRGWRYRDFNLTGARIWGPLQ
jgi:hypothetical protein